MNRRLRYLAHPYESFRTAPIGMSFATAGIGEMVIAATAVAESAPGRPLAEALGVLAVDAAGTLCGAWMTRRQFRLRERLEDSLERRDYDNRIFEPTTQEWCNRQTARVVLEDTDAIDSYEALCETQADNAELKWLPHF
jgi:hypothetical protein